MKRIAIFFGVFAAFFVFALPRAQATIPLMGAGHSAPATATPTPGPTPTAATQEQIAETSSNSASGTSYSTASPALTTQPILVGDLLTLEVYNGTGYVGYAIGTPSGWTSVYNNSSSGAGVYNGQALFTKVATSGDVSANGVVTVTQTTTTSTTFSTAMVERDIQGQTSSTITGFAGSNVSPAINFTSVTPPNVGALGFYTIDTTATSAITPITWSSAPTLTSDYSFVGTVGMAIASGHTSAPAASTTAFSPTATLNASFGAAYSYFYYVP